MSLLELQSDQPLSLDQQIELLGSPDRALQHAAYSALYEQGRAVLDAAVRGLAHPNPRVRRWSADLMDHLGDERCVEPLVRATADPVPGVRRQAVHSLSCQRCKAEPLAADLVPLLIERATADPSIKVRQDAVFGLGMQPPDQRAAAMLAELVGHMEERQSLTKAERVLLRNARFALRRQRASAAAEAQAVSWPINARSNLQWESS
jgi:HEAT repeat protein